MLIDNHPKKHMKKYVKFIVLNIGISKFIDNPKIGALNDG